MIIQGNKINNTRDYWGLYDDGDLREVFLYLGWAESRKEQLGWGRIRKIKVKLK